VPCLTPLWALLVQQVFEFRRSIPKRLKNLRVHHNLRLKVCHGLWYKQQYTTVHSCYFRDHGAAIQFTVGWWPDLGPSAASSRHRESPVRPKRSQGSQWCPLDASLHSGMTNSDTTHGRLARLHYLNRTLWEINRPAILRCHCLKYRSRTGFPYRPARSHAEFTSHKTEIFCAQLHCEIMRNNSTTTPFPFAGLNRCCADA
jgi:hypothetical protein